MLNIIYAGTPEFAVPALLSLSGSRHRVVAVYTQPDRPAGRGRKLQSSPVKQTALELDIPIYQPQSFKSAAEINQLKALQADLMVVAAYGLILPDEILKAPRFGCINIHASLLPRWRGAAPIQRSILAGDAETGITIMQMDKGLDTGDMLARQTVTIKPDWDAGQLHDKLMLSGAELLLPTIDRLMGGHIQPEKQNEAQACYAEKLVKTEAEIDWNKTARALQREVRAYAPWPVSFTQFEGKSLRIWRSCAQDEITTSIPGQILSHNKQGICVSCGEGVLQISELQLSGKKRCSAAQLLNARNLTDLRFGQSSI